MFGSKKCPSCGASVGSDHLYCGQCGADLAKSRDAALAHNAWQARDDEFAARIHVANLKGFFGGRSLQVSPGSQAFVFDKGRNTAVVKAGSYTLDTFIQRLGRLGAESGIEAVVCREAPLPVVLRFYELLNRDYLPLNVEIGLSLEIADPASFVSNYMGPGRNAVTTAHMTDLLHPIMQQVLSEQLRQKGVEDLAAGERLRSELVRLLEQGLHNTLDRYGLRIAEVQTVQVQQTAYDDNNRIVAEAWLDSDRKRKELDANKRLTELHREEEMNAVEQVRHGLQIKRLLREAEYQGREDEYTRQLREVDLLDRISQAETREAAIKLGAAEQLDRLTDERRRRGEQQAEEEADWQQTRALARRERDQALQRMDELNRHEMEKLVVENDYQEQRQVRQLEIELARLSEDEAQRQRALQLEQEQQQAERERNERIRALDDDLAASRKRFEEAMYQEQARREADHAQQRRDAEIAQANTRAEIDQKAERRARQREHMDGMVDLQAKVQAQNEAARDAEHQRELTSTGQQQAHELARMDKLAQMGPEALIHLSSAEQGEVIAGLRRTEIMKGMSEEQILALAAENSPAVAEALKERFSASRDNTDLERERALYERLLQAERDTVHSVREMASGERNALLQGHQITANANVEITRALGGAAGQPTAHVGHQHSTATHESVSLPERVLICPKCRRENSHDARVCAYCGQPM